MPHHLCQRTDGGLVNICHLKQGGIQFISRSHGGYDRHPCFLCLYYDRKLSGNRVDRIHDIVIFVKIKELLCIRQKEGFIRPYPAVRIYIMYPFFCHIHLISAYRFPRGDYLSVDICKADPVIIYKIQRSYPASCKSLDHVAAHSSYPEDRDTGGCKPFHRFGPV